MFNTSTLITSQEMAVPPGAETLEPYLSLALQGSIAIALAFGVATVMFNLLEKTIAFRTTVRFFLFGVICISVPMFQIANMIYGLIFP